MSTGLKLSCPYCGDDVEVEISETGGYYREKVVDAIACSSYRCDAAWSPHDGDVLRLPQDQR